MAAHIFSSEKKVRSARTTGKVITVFLGHGRPHNVEFLEKGTTMNSDKYCEILNTVR